MTSPTIRLTQYSHGAGCGCKISPQVLETILHSEQAKFVDPRLLVGNETRDDAAVYDIGNGTGVISTTDFFMPIVDDPFDFGRIAAANAISDVYAMGGKPIMANQMERNVEAFYQRLQGVVVADHRSNFDIQATVGAFHQQIAQAVGLFGDQHHDAATSGAVQFARGAFRQRIIQVGQQRGVVEDAFQFGAHKEAPGAMIDKLIVLHDVELMFVANIGDLGDQAFRVRADGA